MHDDKTESFDLGAYRVGLTFNPSGSAQVQKIKEGIAQLINQIQELEPDLDNEEVVILAENNLFGQYKGEVQRCKALACTSLEEGAMWAVKAATKPIPI